MTKNSSSTTHTTTSEREEKSRHFYADEDRQVIELSHPPDSLTISALSAKHIEGLEFFGIYDPDWGDRWMAFLQFLICYCMFSDWEKR